MEYLWRRKQYRPPWLWSIIDILRHGKKILEDMRIQCDIVGGGNIRGPHNCNNCNKKLSET